jgi:hypothetical protein
MKRDIKPADSARAIPERPISERIELAGLDLTSDDGLSQALASLPVRTTPPGLTTSLRVIASRERQRVVGSSGFGRMFAQWYDRASLGMTNVMRPLALPFAGGVFSAVALFSMWLVPTYPMRATAGFEAPKPSTPSLSPWDLYVDMVLEVNVDDQGHMVDYTVVSGGAGALQDPAVRRQLEEFLDTTFVPSASGGRTKAGKIRIPVFTSSIVVKG